MSKKNGTQVLVPKFESKIDLADYDTGYIGRFQSEEETLPEVESMLKKIGDLQEILYAENKQSLLLIVQAMDTGGKDGLIKHLFRGINPSGVRITSFKVPSSEEQAHDFLWRIHKETPRTGMIGVFNRSQYEDVLVVRVRNLVPKDVWKKRYDQINNFERMLAENGTRILKFYLHISRAEQKKRLESRLKNPDKHWKFNPGDVEERAFWDDYMAAYAEAISKCNTEYAPWHIVPADHKWYRNYAVTKAVLETLESMNPAYPVAPTEIANTVVPE